MRKNNCIYYLLLLLSLASCDGMYENIREYRDRGVINYLGKPDSVYITAGKERVKVSWWLNNDPRIRSCNIYWNERRDSLVVPVDRNALDKDGYMSTIVNIPEGNYIFLLNHTSSDGERSIVSEAVGTSYGADYESKLITRRIINATIRSGVMTINWRSAEENEVQTTLEYLSTSGAVIQLIINPEDTQTTIADYVLEDGFFSFLKTSSYLPEPHALDIFSVSSREAFVPEIYLYWLDRKTWTAEASSNHLGGEYVGPMGCIDGNTSTFWHSNTGQQYPHWVVIDMKENKMVKQVQALQHGYYTYIKTMKISLSVDGENWTEAGTMTYTNNPTTDLILTELLEARYIRIDMIESNGSSYANLSEVYVYGAD